MTEAVLASELRLALAMRGGVSLSVWIGGAVREIERFRGDVIVGSAEPNGWPESALAAVARAAGYSKVQIDVVSGASAGGLNAVILGAAMANGRSLDMLRTVWLEAAAIENLLNQSSRTPHNSILRGDYFLDALRANLTELMKAKREDQTLVVERLDVFLSVTSVVSNQLSAVLDPTAPVTEQRIDGQIHLRKRDALLNEFAPARVDDLARAARSTAAFPVAFEPLRVEPDELVGDIDFRPTRPDPLLLFDGGVTDNMPVGKAARAIESAPADGPTDRLLLYLHPSPGVPDATAAKRALVSRADLATNGARPFDVIRTTIRSLRTKSLLDDLQAIEAHNETVEQQLTDRDRLLQPLTRSTPAPTTETSAVIAPELDAERLVDLFASPWEHVAEHIPPVEFAPQAGGRNGEGLDRLTRRLAQELAATTLPRAADLPVLSRSSLRPWGAAIRITSLLIEWCQCAGEDARVVDAVGAEKLRLYDLRDAVVRAAAALNVETLEQIPDLPHDDADAARLIVRRRVPKVTEQLGSVVEQWNEITAIAADLAALMPRTVSQAQQSFAFADGAPEVAIAGAPAGHELRRALERLLPPTATTEDASRALDQIDLALLPLHRGEPRGSLERIRYLTISGNAGTPLAASFTWPSELAEPEPRFATVRPLPKGESTTGDLQFDHTRSDASSKLAGNQLHNFSSFLERSWRINDWMWGQMDAAATLVDLVLDPARLAQMSTTWRNDLTDSIHRICTGPLRVGGSVHQWSRAIVEVAEGVWTDAVIEHVRDELAAVAPGSPVPPVTRTLLLWRRHTEIAAVEFDREQDNGPTGKPRPASLTEGMGQWDATSRAITDKWGEKRVTALGMRTVFVGWRALFARVKLWPFGLVRSLLGPILAPLAMFTLCRRRTSFAFAVFLFGFVVPRVWSSGVGRVLVGVLAVAFASVWLLLTRATWVDDQGRHRRRFDFVTEFWGAATIVATLAVLVELVLVKASWLRNVRPETPLRGGLWPYVLPVGAVAIVTFVTWYWAKLRWRVVITVLNAAIAGGWVWFAAKTATDEHEPWQSLQLLGSFWWALIVMILVTTLLGYNVDFADVPEPADA